MIRDGEGVLVVRLKGVTPAALALALQALESQLRDAFGRRRVRRSGRR